MRPAVWQLIDEATQQLVGEMAYADIKKHVWAKHPDVNSSTLTCQIIICTVNHPSRIHYPENKKPRICNSQYDFLYHTGRGRVVRYDPSQHGEWEIADKNGALLVRMSQEATDESDQASGSTCEDQGGIFALESHLRDYLAKNLPTLDEGKTSLNLYVSPDGRDGVEFQTEVGPTDILAVSQAGDFYVFELKSSGTWAGFNNI
jgi:hypothetical protein